MDNIEYEKASDTELNIITPVIETFDLDSLYESLVEKQQEKDQLADMYMSQMETIEGKIAAIQIKITKARGLGIKTKSELV